ncbi:MAG TPA: hypothetical protein DEF04_00010 [Clostridiales bacterium]|nr:hypothetical protein [Clostridiales bacterium]
MGKIVLIGSQKRDIGKTVVCIKTGVSLSDAGSKVLLVDLSSGKKKISEYLDVNENVIYDIKDVLNSTCTLDQAAIEVKEDLWLLPYPRIADKLSVVKAEEFSRLINEAASMYDFIIVDADKISMSFIDFRLVNAAVTVNNNDFSCIREINADREIAHKFDIKNIFVMLNKFNRKKASKGAMLNPKDIQKMTEMNISSIIEENTEYENADCVFMFSSKENSFNKEIEKLADEIRK